MVQKTINIALDLKRVTPQSKSIPILVEGDTGNIFVITLTDDGVPVDLSSCKVLAVFSKVSDGTTSEQDTEDALVSLSDYGLVLTGTPTTNDTITVTVLNGSAIASTDVSGGSVAIDQDAFLEKLPDDGTYIFTFDSPNWLLGANSVVISGANHNVITIDLKNSSYGSGKNVCELQVYSGTNFETLVTSAQFNFDGRKGISNSDTIKRTGEYPILANLIIMAREALSLAYPWANVTVTAVAGNSAGVTVTQDADSVELDFIIPNSVYVGNDPPTGDEEVWIIPGGEGGSQEGTTMSTEVYDQDNDGIVDNSEKLGGQLPSYYATASALSAEATARDAAIAAAVPAATTTTPAMDGTAAVGTETKWAKGDHVHPTDTSRAPVASPGLTGVPTAPTAAITVDSDQIATTKFVKNWHAGAVSVTTPKMDGTASTGTEGKWARGDHVHPSDTSRAAAAITGTTALASGDGLIFADSSDGGKLKRSSITFDGSTTSKALTQKGTWGAFLVSSDITSKADLVNSKVKADQACASIYEVTGSSYTLGASDAGRLVKANRSSAQTITVPPHASVGYAIGTEIEIVRWGAGEVTIAAGSGVAIYCKYSGRKIVNVYGGVILKKMDTNTWLLDGDLG